MQTANLSPHAPEAVAVLMAAIAAVILLGGCTSTGARVSLNCDFSTRSAIAQTLPEASSCARSLVTKLQNKLDEQDRSMDISRVGVIAGTLGAGAAGLYGAHRDVMLGLGLVGAGSYAYGNLYAPPPYKTIFLAGIDAAACVDAIGRKTAAEMHAVRAGSAALAASVSALNGTLEKAKGKGVENTLLEAARNALENAKAAERVASGVLAQEVQFANSIVNATYEISTAVDQQIAANTPQLDAFYSASSHVIAQARSLGSIGATPPPEVKSLPADKSGVQLEAARTINADIVKLSEELKRETGVVEANTASLRSTLDKRTSPDATPCVGRARSVNLPGLTISPAVEEISLAKGETYNLVISGGLPTYDLSGWSGTGAPLEELTADRVNNRLTFHAKTALKRSYVYAVRDAANTEKRILINPK